MWLWVLDGSPEVQGQKSTKEIWGSLSAGTGDRLSALFQGEEVSISQRRVSWDVPLGILEKSGYKQAPSLRDREISG